MTWISGGTMFGNCATGRVSIDTRPTITIRMAITIATMGRLMKNFDITGLLGSPAAEYPAWDSPCAPSRTFEVPSETTRSPGFRPLRNDPQLAHAIAHLHVADADFVVRSHHGHLIAPLQFGHGVLRNQQRAACGMPSAPGCGRTVPAAEGSPDSGTSPRCGWCRSAESTCRSAKMIRPWCG